MVECRRASASAVLMIWDLGSATECQKVSYGDILYTSDMSDRFNVVWRNVSRVRIRSITADSWMQQTKVVEHAYGNSVYVGGLNIRQLQKQQAGYHGHLRTQVAYRPA